MKKILFIFVLFIVLMCLTSCTIEKGSSDSYGLISTGSHEYNANGSSYIAYDPDTHVCYMVCYAANRLSVCPYYIIGSDGKPEIAVYGVNYMNGGDH